MIKTNTILALLVLCAVLGIGFFVIQGERPVVGVATQVGENLIKDLNTDAVKAIEIKKGGVNVQLEKKDKSWTLTSHKNRQAKNDRVEALLTNLKSAKLEDTRRGGDELFALDEKNRTELTLKTESGDKKVYLGKSPDWNKAFVRTSTTGDIYEIDKGLDGDAGIRTEKDDRILDASHFYDLKIFNFNADDVIDIAIKKENAVTRVQKVLPGKNEPLKPNQELGKDDKPIWWLTEPEGMAADEGAAGSIASTLANLNAKSYADNVEAKDLGTDKPAAKVKLRMKDGSEQNLTFGKMEGDDIILVVDGKTDPYKVYKYVFENVTKDLKKKEEEKKSEAGEPPIPQLGPAHPPIPHAHGAPKTDVKPVTPKSAEQVPPPPPPPTIDAKEAKPILPPAVVKEKDDSAKKIEEKK